MRVVAWSHNLTTERCREVGVELVSRQALLSSADFVTIHVPLGDRYRGLLGAAELASMRRTAFLVNTSRGPVIDERALVAALEQGSIAGAGLDVFDVEPLPPDHPFLKLPNVVVTPHQGYVTAENFRLFFEGAVGNVRAWLDGTIVNALS